MSDSLITQLGALMYYDEERLKEPEKPKKGKKKAKKASFEELPSDIQDNWITRAENVLLALDKCNMKVIDKSAIVTHEERQKDLNTMTSIIEGFVKGIDFKKLNSSNYFPAQELAMKLYD